MGVFADKDYRQIGEIMSSCGDCVFCFQPEHERGLASDVLAAAMAPYFSVAMDVHTAEQAVQQAMSQAKDDDVIVSFGSLSTIKAVRDALTNREVQHETN